MPRIDWVEERLQNWALWWLGRRGELGYGSSNPLGAGGGGGYREATVPIMDAEASNTDEAIGRLSPPGLALTVREFYAGAGGIADKAQRLACSEATIHRRVEQAHAQLAEDFRGQRERAQAERARVERLQQRG